MADERPAPVQVRIRYRGRGSLEQFGVAAPEPEIISTRRVWDVGDELVPYRHGWFVHEVTIEREKMTFVVELRPPDA